MVQTEAKAAKVVGVPREVSEGERRVGLSPEAAAKLIKQGFQVLVQVGAGEASNFRDAHYESAGCRIVPAARDLYASSDIVIKVQPPVAVAGGVHEVDLLREGTVLISFIWPARNGELLERLKNRRISTLAMDAVPRISRAQKLDALSSMANIAGYRAVIEAAHHFGSFFTGQITAAGKVPPARVMVIGAGVAGLAAIGAARGLGAIVRAFDTRPEVKDQVRSMGAEFLELDFKEDGAGEGGYAKVMSEAFIKAEMELFARQAREVDIIITTALIPGKKAPELITAEMVRSMKEGSVIVDLAAEQGGNCALTVPGQVVRQHGVTIIGYADLPGRMPTQASRLFGNNVVNFFQDLNRGGTFKLDLEDEVIRGALVTDQGKITWPPPRPAAAPAPAKPAAAAAKTETAHGPKPVKNLGVKTTLFLGVLALVMIALGRSAPADFLAHFSVFVLACFVGWQVIWNVTPALHTPLMSVTNAISGIIVIGAILQIGDGALTLRTGLAALAILIATINVAGGFLVTQRMLTMFRK